MQTTKVKEVQVAEVVDGLLTNVTSEYVPAPVIKKHFNSRYFAKSYEINDQPSQTVPDDAMTIQEIVNRYAHGMPLPPGRAGEYFPEDSDLPHDLDNLDLAEREEILREVARKRDEIIESVQERKKQAQEKRLEAVVNKRIKDRDDRRAEYEKLQKEFAPKGGEQ